MAENKKIKEAEKIIGNIIKSLEIDGDFELSENDEGLEVTLQTEDSGIVIGYHGEVLESLQFVLSLAVSQQLGEFTRITLDVGDYRKNREEWLKNLALQTKEKVLSENKEYSMPQLRPWERRVVHLLLQDDKEVVSESVGEGRDRYLIIKPK